VDPEKNNGPAVLVVDDDVLVNIGTVDMIQDMGLQALEAYSGKEALDLLAENAAVRVLITDYSMPGMNGIELAGKALALRPDLHVVLATGYGELPGGEVCDLPRLSKPLQPADLEACLQQALGAEA
jgi:Response regulator containing CheY-like receiver domain and AraC-type DNA-binding domain